MGWAMLTSLQPFAEVLTNIAPCRLQSSREISLVHMPQARMISAGRAKLRSCKCCPERKCNLCTCTSVYICNSGVNVMPCALQPSDTPFAFEDCTGAQLAPDSNEEQKADIGCQPAAAEEPAGAEQPEGHRRRPVWQDTDDQTVQIDVAAKSQLRRLRQARSRLC